MVIFARSPAPAHGGTGAGAKICTLPWRERMPIMALTTDLATEWFSSGVSMR